MNRDESKFLPPSRTSVRRIFKNFVYVLLGFIITYLLMHYLVMFNYTKIGKMQTEKYGERLSRAILNYADNYDGVLPSGLSNPETLQAQLNSDNSDFIHIEDNKFMFGVLNLNASISSRYLSTLDSETELFTITNTSLFNNFKIVHYVDGTKTSSKLP